MKSAASRRDEGYRKKEGALNLRKNRVFMQTCFYVIFMQTFIV